MFYCLKKHTIFIDYNCSAEMELEQLVMNLNDSTLRLFEID